MIAMKDKKTSIRIIFSDYEARLKKHV